MSELKRNKLKEINLNNHGQAFRMKENLLQFLYLPGIICWKIAVILPKLNTIPIRQIQRHNRIRKELLRLSTKINFYKLPHKSQKNFFKNIKILNIKVG